MQFNLYSYLAWITPFSFCFRFELALYAFLAKDALCKAEHPEQENPTSEMGMGTHSNSSKMKGKSLIDNDTSKILESELGHINLKDEREGHNAARNILVELADCVVDFQSGLSDSKQPIPLSSTQSNLGPRYSCDARQTSSLSNTFSDGLRTSCSYVEMPIAVGTTGLGANEVAMDGPSEEGSCYLNNNDLLSGDQSTHCSSMNPSCNSLLPNEWGRCGLPPFTCGDRVGGKRQVKVHAKGTSGVCREEYDAFANIFEGGSLLYCNMSFEALLNVRRQLEELGFPCKAVNDGLWLQVRILNCLDSSTIYKLLWKAKIRSCCPYFQLVFCIWHTKEL